MSTKDGYTYMVTAKTPAKIDEWLAADSKGKWFLENKDELVVDRIGF
jgi:frataxin-like iron-binding protein CyaY